MLRLNNDIYRTGGVDKRFQSFGRGDAMETDDISPAGTRRQTKRENDAEILRSTISDYEKRFLEYLVQMHNTLREDKINLTTFARLSDYLQHMKAEQNDEYLDALVKPEFAKGCKIPTNIPVPSSSFQLHNSIAFTPNANGHAAIIFNPFFLSTNTTAGSLQLSTCYLNKDVSVTGSASSNFFYPINVGQTIPPVYNSYRLVSVSYTHLTLPTIYSV